MPRYLLLLHDAGTMPEGIGPDEIQAIIQRYVTWRKKVEAAGHAVMGTSCRTARAACCAPPTAGSA